MPRNLPKQRWQDQFGFEWHLDRGKRGLYWYCCDELGERCQHRTDAEFQLMKRAGEIMEMTEATDGLDLLTILAAENITLASQAEPSHTKPSSGRGGVNA